MTRQLDTFEIVKKRLDVEFDECKNLSDISRKYDVNVRYVWDVVVKGKMPSSPKACRRLGIAPIRKILTPAQLATRQRNADLATRACAKGWATLSECLTAVLHDEAELPEKEMR